MHTGRAVWVSQQALSVNGKRAQIQQSDMLAVAKTLNIKKPIEILEEIRSTICEWPSFAQEVQVDQKFIQAIQSTYSNLETP
jgi:serine/threonine-protein kinase HipA